MRYSLFFFYCLVCWQTFFSKTIPEQFAASPSKFIENKGQFMDVNGHAVPFVYFKSSAPGMDYFITNSGITYVFFDMKEDEEHEEKQTALMSGYKKKKPHIEQQVKSEIVEMVLVGSTILKQNIVREQASNNLYHYFLPVCPDGIYDIQEFSKITIKEVYPGIDWVIYGNNEVGLKYDFIVHPGANAKDIRLLYRSNKKARLEKSGDISIHTSLGDLKEKSPLSYIQSNQLKINSFYELRSEKKTQNHHEVEYQIAGDFEKFNNQTVIIDPQLLWATFLGGNGIDGSTAIETDAAGNVFVSGYTASANFPVLNNGNYFQSTYPNVCAFILKFDNAGTLLWSTYYGGTNGTNLQEFSPLGLAVDNFGNLFVCGRTGSFNLPLQNNGSYFQLSNSSNNNPTSDLYILKFTNNGIRQWATYYGGTGTDLESSIDTDPNGNLYICGRTFSNNLPLQNSGGYFQSSYVSSSSGIGFVAKFDNVGNLLWSTYFGNYFTCPTVVNCDVNGNVFLTGYNSGLGVPMVNPGLPSYFQSTPSPTTTNYYCFISKFDGLANLVWSTQYGGSGTQLANTLISDAVGNIFVGGVTSALNFPVLAPIGGYLQFSFSTYNNAFLLKFNNAGVRQFATFCGGTNISPLFTTYDNMAVEPCSQSIYYTFGTKSAGLTTATPCGGAYVKSSFSSINPGDDGEIVILKFSNLGALLWSTYFGGTGNDFRSSVATDSNGSLFMTGEWASNAANYILSTYPLTDPGGGAYFDPTPNGSDELYVAKFGYASSGGFYYPPNLCFNAGTIFPQIASASTGGKYYTTAGLSLDSITGAVNCNASNSGTYVVTYTSPTCICNYSQVLTATLNILPILPSTSILASASAICPGQSATLSASNNNISSLNYLWLPSSISGTSITANPNSTTIYTLVSSVLTGTCATTNTFQLEVSSFPTITVSGPSVVCASTSCQINASGASSYTWNTGNNTSSIVLTPIQNLTLMVAGTNSIGCVSQTQQLINVIPGPNVSVLGITNICKGDQGFLTAYGSATFSWSNGGTGSSFNQVLYQSATINLTATASNGCVQVHLINFLVDDCTGIKETENSVSGFEVFPNPSTGELTIRCEEKIHLILDDDNGRLIEELDFENGAIKQTRKLAEGVYFLHGIIKGKIQTEKIVIQK